MDQKPIMLYDGDCSFCQRSIERWAKIVRDAVRYAPYQEVVQQYPQVTLAQCRDAVQLVLTNGRALSGAHAVFKSFSLARRYGWLLWFYERFPLCDRLSEAAYQWVAHHRFQLSRLFSRTPSCPT